MKKGGKLSLVKWFYVLITVFSLFLISFVWYFYPYNISPRIYLNSFGLIININGALIFAHGLLLSNRDIEEFSGGVTYGGKVDGLKQLLKKNKREAIIGVGAITFGFILQFISQFS